MEKIYFNYPFMIFQKCKCMQQIPIKEIHLQSEDNNTILLKYEVTCTCCGNVIRRAYKVAKGSTELTSDINAFKIIPSIKDEIALVKLDTIKAKIKNNELFLYGNYSHLRFFDNAIENDVIPISYTRNMQELNV
ncbi:MAG: hypothetical protein ACOWWH_03305 [Eubacteriaceae bacterium]